MKTLKQKVLTPLILLIVLLPLATLLFFNIAMQVYVQKAARNDLKEAMLPIETLAQQELNDSNGTLTEPALESAAIKLTQTIQSTKLTNAKLLIYNSNEKLVSPKNLPDGFISANLAKKVSVRLKAADLKERIAQVKVGNQTYLIYSYVLKENADNQIFIVLVNQLGNTQPLIKMINVILITIMLLGIILGVFFVSRITDRIARNVKQISIATEQIGRGNFAHLEWESSDISEFNQLFQSVTYMSDKLEAAENSQRDFLQNASHELRTPLMSIQGYAEGISSGIVPDVKAAADIINSESHRLNELVSELLTLSRIENGTMMRELSKLNLCALLPEFVQRLGGLAVKLQKKIDLNLPPLPFYIMGEEELLGQAVTNVISNCLRYANKRVAVSLLSGENSQVIRIHDDGPGIPDGELPHIFERFYKGKGGNFGLGLAIAKSAVQFIGGDIKAYNEAAGAAFDIVFNSTVK